MSHYAATLQDTAQKVKSHYIAFVNSSQFEVSFLLATRELILVNCVCLSRPAVKCLSVSSDCVLGWAQSSQETLELTDCYYQRSRLPILDGSNTVNLC